MASSMAQNRLCSFGILFIGGFVLGDTDWGYFSGPHIDPKHWSTAYQQCAGHQQSPVRIETPDITAISTLPPLEFHNYDKKFYNTRILNDGHSIKIEVRSNLNKSSQPTVTSGLFNGTLYQLVQAHFHWGETNDVGSEHIINNKHFPLEMHYVHMKENISDAERLKKGSMLVLAVLFRISNENNTNFGEIIDSVDHLTRYDHRDNTPSTYLAHWQWDQLLPENKGDFYWYGGSLTTPPCSEVVEWFIFTETVPMSAMQLAHFHHLQHFPFRVGPGRRKIPMPGVVEEAENDRPAQPLYGRKIKWRQTKYGNNSSSKYIF